jgi:hypothetical protein
MVNKTDAEEKGPKEHLAEWMVRIIEDNDSAGKPARDAMRTIVYALVSVVNERGGPAQIRTLKSELQKIARDLPPVGK